MPDKYDIRNEWLFIQGKIPHDIAAFMNDIFFIVERRQRVGDVNSIVFEIRSRERNHTLPHVHASYAEYSISIAIEDGRILEGDLPQKKSKKASKWVIDHKEELLTKWSTFAISATSAMTKSLLNTDFNCD